MTDWKFELTEAAIVTLTSAALIIFRGRLILSAVIFAAVILLCIYRTFSRRTQELKLQWHWLILAVAAGLLAFKLAATAIIFLMAHSAARFFISLIRYGETAEKAEEFIALDELHEQELSKLRRESESRLKNALDDLSIKHLEDKLHFRAELQSKLAQKNKPPHFHDD